MNQAGLWQQDASYKLQTLELFNWGGFGGHHTGIGAPPDPVCAEEFTSHLQPLLTESEPCGDLRPSRKVHFVPFRQRISSLSATTRRHRR